MDDQRLKNTHPQDNPVEKDKATNELETHLVDILEPYVSMGSEGMSPTLSKRANTYNIGKNQGPNLFVDIGMPKIVSEDLVRSVHWVTSLQNSIISFFTRNWSKIGVVTTVACYCLYFTYLAWACWYDLNLAKPLLIITSLTVLVKIYIYIRDTHGDRINDACCSPVGDWLDRHWHLLKWFVYVSLMLGIVYYLLFRVVNSWRQVQSLAGMALFMFVPWLTCIHPGRINWRPVLWGMGLQFILGVFVLRWEPGYEAVKWFSQEINKYLFYSLAGAAGAFGDPWFFLHAFLMLVIPLVVHVGCTTAIFFHLGLVQLFSKKLGWLMKITLQTTAIESISLGVNIFLSVLDSMLMLKSYFPLLTKSEFHCFLVGAHSTIAGFAFGLFVLFGVKPQHLLTGAVMSAPAAVAIAKLNFPETEESKLKNDEDFDLGNGGAANIYLAATQGAWEAGKGGAEILVQTLAFVAIIIFADDIVIWMGSLVGIEVSMASILGYMFMPFAYLMGVDAADLEKVSRLLGLKVIANEFLAYLVLGRYIREGEISERSGAIATYAMCGFSSFGTMAIFTGVWNSVYPQRASEVSSQIPRIMMNSNLACFLTASIASIFYDESIAGATPPLDGPLVSLVAGLPGYEDILNTLGFYQYEL